MKRAKAPASPDSGESLNEFEVPEGWVSTSVGELFHIVGGGTPSTKNPENWEGDIPWISSADIYGLKKIVPRRNINKTAIENSAAHLVPKGSIIVVTRVSLGRIAICETPISFSQDCHALIPKTDAVDPEFALYYLSQAVQSFKSKSRGTTISGVTIKVVSSLPFPLPPFTEQHRIVARVEALLTQVDAARDRLSRVPLIMKKFRQAVLAAACEGRLTEGWRTEQKNLESAADLYNRIQSARMHEYEQAGIEAKKQKKRLPPKPSFLENIEPDSDDTNDIPDEWIWKKVVNLGPIGEDTVKTGPFGAILKSKEFVSSGVPVIAIGNVQWGKFDLNGARVDHVTEEKASELENYRVRTGDVLFTRSGTIGRSLVVPDFADHWLMSYHLLRVRADSNLIVPQYLYFVFAGCESSKEYTSDATIGSTRPGINTKILENLPVPLPPLAEQYEIVRRIDALFERGNHIEQQIFLASRRTEALTQAILGKAFAGKL